MKKEDLLRSPSPCPLPNGARKTRSYCGSRPVSRVLCLGPPSPYPLLEGAREMRSYQGGSHLSGTPVAGRLEQPTRGCGGPPHLPLCGLAPGGVCPRERSPAAPCALTARLHPYRSAPSPCPLSKGEREMRSYRTAVCFCGTFLGVAPTGHYPAPCPLVPGLSSAGDPPYVAEPAAAARPAPALDSTIGDSLYASPLGGEATVTGIIAGS